ncbi:MAG: GAF domain-containing protein [Gammaproteobacteria bacterium]
MLKSKLESRLSELKAKQELIEKSWKKTGNKELLQFFVEIMPKALDAERCSIFILDPVDDNAWIACGTGLPEKGVTVPLDNSIVGKVISTGKHIIETEMEKQIGAHDTVAIKTGFVTRSAICVPVMSVTKDKVVGAIQVLNKNNLKQFDDEDRIVLEKLAYHLQMNIENIFLRQEMAKISLEMSKEIKTLEAKLGIS